MAVPYQRHQKQKQRQQDQQQRSSFSLSVLRGLPFWVWNQQQHTEEHIRTNGKCCFNHVVGLPTKDHKEFPLFDYEKLLYDTLMSSSRADRITNFKDKHLWCLKSTGLGVSEFFLRLMAWLCTSTNDTKILKCVL